MDKWRKARGILFAILIIVIGLGIGAHALLGYLNKPSDATKISESAPPAQQAVPTTSKPVAVDGTFADFNYPSTFSPLKQQPASGNIVATYAYRNHASMPWQLSITVNYLPGGYPNNDSAYYAMSQNTSEYSKTAETVSGSSVALFTNTTSGGYNKVAIVFNGSHSADIALSSEDAQNIDKEDAVLQQVVQSWHWN